jgi:hypothetical protein
MKSAAQENLNKLAFKTCEEIWFTFYTRTVRNGCSMSGIFTMKKPDAT